MIPIPPATKRRFLRWVPTRLNGYDYPLIETDTILPDLTTPAITFRMSPAGGSVDFSNTLIRVTKSEAGEFDDYWGQFHSATVSFVLRELDRDRMEAMWLGFLSKIHSTRRNLLLRLDKVRVVEVLDSVQLDPERLPTDDVLYMAQVDLRIEYEISAVSDAEYMKKFSIDQETGGSVWHFEDGDIGD